MQAGIFWCENQILFRLAHVHFNKINMIDLLVYACVQASEEEDTVQWQQLHTESVQALAEAHEQLRLATALAAPDPAASAWQLNITVDSTCYFLTEGATAEGLEQQQEQQQLVEGVAAQEQQQQLRASPLGLSPTVPKLLRWAGKPLPLVPLSLQELEEMIWALWQVRGRYVKMKSDRVIGELVHVDTSSLVRNICNFPWHRKERCRSL